MGVFLPSFEKDSYTDEIRSNLYDAQSKLNRIGSFRDAAASMSIFYAQTLRRIDYEIYTYYH